MIHWIVLSSAILTLLLGIFVLLSNPNKPLYSTFFLYSTVTALWTFDVFLFAYSGFKSLLILKIMFALGALVVPTGILWFDYLYKERGSAIRKIWVITLGLGFALISLIDGAVVSGVGPPITEDKGLIFHLYSYNLEFQTGPLTTFYGIYLILSTVYLLYRILLGIKNSIGARRLQLWYIFYGIAGFGGTTIVVNVIMPFIYGMNTVSFADALSSLIFTSLAATAIFKHRFMDIRLVVARSLAYVILIGTFTVIYAYTAVFLERLFLAPHTSTGAEFNLIRISLAVLMAAGFAPAKNWITRHTDRLFLRDQYNTENLLNLISGAMSETVDLKTILQKSTSILSAQMNIPKIVAVIINENKINTLVIHGSDGVDSLTYNDIATLTHSNVVFCDNIDDESFIKNLLQKLNLSVSIPLKTASNYYGVLLLGSKNNGAIYNSRDAKLLTTICSEIAINTELWLKVAKAMTDLEQANKRLTDLDYSKSEFLAMISHNLRTPMTLIEGYLSYLAEMKNFKDEEQTRLYLNEMTGGVNRLHILMEDVILATSIVNGKRKIIDKQFKPSKLLAELKTKYSNEIKDKNLSLDILIDQDSLFCDEKLVQSIFSNLFDNAVKFNKPRGSITIKEQLSDSGIITFSFSDSGIGIPADKQVNLFDKFARETDLYHYQYEGIGLGLYLVKLIVELLGGKIWFESTEGQGSTFYFSLKQPELAVNKIDSTLEPILLETAAS